MAGELQVTPTPYQTGKTAYSQVLSTSAQIWRTDTLVFETYTTANIAHYAIPLAEQGTASGRYVGNFPTQIPAGVYHLQAFIQLGAGAAEGDTLVGERADFPWSGSLVSAGVSYLPQAQAGASNGLLISGSNTGPMSISGGVTFTNATGSGFTCSSTGSNGNGINCSGNGTGDGLAATGGATGRGVHAVGGATSGAGFRAEAAGGNSNGIESLGLGSASGFVVTAGATGDAVVISGGATSGQGITVTTTNGDAVEFAATGSGHNGLTLTGGANGDGLHAQGAGNANGIHAVGGGSGDGIAASGGTTGRGIHALGGATSGAGFRVEAQGGNANGMECIHNGTGVDLQADLGGRVLGNTATVFIGAGVDLDLTQEIPLSNVSNSVGDCLNAARAQGFGNWVIDKIAKTLTLYGPDGTTNVHQFNLDSITAPTSRT